MTTEAGHRDVAKPVKLDPAPPPTAVAEPGTRADDTAVRGAWRASGGVGGIPVEVWTWLPAAPTDTTGEAAGEHEGHPREVA